MQKKAFFAFNPSESKVNRVETQSIEGMKKELHLYLNNQLCGSLVI